MITLICYLFLPRNLLNPHSIHIQHSCTYSGVCDLELSEDVLGHVVLCHGINHKVLVPGRALRRPVLVTFFLFEQKVDKPFN